MVSFDEASLFTNVPLEGTIEIILKRIYMKKEITANIPKQEMKELLILFTKKLHFTFNNETYIQVEGVAMGSPLGPVLANIFGVELDTSVIPNLSNKVKLRKRFVDDKFCLARLEYIDNILLALNSFHKNIKFTFEIEKDNTSPFLDILIIRKPGKIKTAVYRKKTCTDLHMNWYSFVPKSWKWGTLKTLVRRAHINCFTEKHLKEELIHIRKTFKEINNYPHCVIRNVFKEIKGMTPSEKKIQVKEDKNTSIKNHVLVLPCQGEKGIHIVNSMKRYVNKILPKNIKVQTAFTGK